MYWEKRLEKTIAFCLCFRCDIEYMSQKANIVYRIHVLLLSNTRLYPAPTCLYYNMYCSLCVSVKRLRPINLHLTHLANLNCFQNVEKTSVFPFNATFAADEFIFTFLNTASFNAIVLIDMKLDMQ